MSSKIIGRPPKEIDILIGDCNSCDGVLKQSTIEINSDNSGYEMKNIGRVAYGKNGCEMKVYSEPEVLP